MSILTVRCLHHQACLQSQCLSWFGPLGTKLENTDGLRVQLEGEPRSGGGDPEAPEVGKICFQGNLLDPVGGECLWSNLAAVSQGGPSDQPHCASSGPSISGHVLVRSGGVPSSHLCGIHVAPVCSWDPALSCMSNRAQASPGCVSQIIG